ncbi:DUF998 domain-containing protein [Tessaracoccus caeni]|uniref:DUF998 domain-containing protein n=1 Tax=Tessaracoccus caeni TaxID=3031239 RepID=UPI0023DB944D|nr:DUF998 domain-containing protein [Tessaracoccus caeni]MDF1488166.1 DUF998 domain-containing protein [Tessaracoccus caeni]
MKRYRIGAFLLIASAALIPIQVVVASAWPDGYSLTRNAISDLGVTVCGEFAEQGQQLREVCSPLHPLFNAGMVLTGILVAAGALLVSGYWGSALGRVGAIFLALSGLGVIGAGLAPWDIAPDVHDLAALAQAVAQWVAMVCFAVAAGRGAFRWFTVAALMLSVAGFAGFIAALDGVDIPVLGFGGTERLSFDTLTVWVVVLGATILRRPREQGTE